MLDKRVDRLEKMFEALADENEAPCLIVAIGDRSLVLDWCKKAGFIYDSLAQHTKIHRQVCKAIFWALVIGTNEHKLAAEMPDGSFHHVEEVMKAMFVLYPKTAWAFRENDRDVTDEVTKFLGDMLC